MAATLKCTKLQIQRDAQDSPTPHKVTCYATDTASPGVGSVSASAQCSNATIEAPATLRLTLDGAFTALGLPTVDWTK